MTLVVNDVYANRVCELVEKARQTTAYSDHPSFRMLQILTRLTTNPMTWVLAALALHDHRQQSRNHPVLWPEDDPYQHFVVLRWEEPASLAGLRKIPSRRITRRSAGSVLYEQIERLARVG